MIELLIVIIIIGILASVSVTIIKDIKAKAISTEAVAVMGMIRAAARGYWIQNTDGFEFHDFLLPYSSIFSKLGFTPDDLQGTYFGKECYAIDIYPASWGFLTKLNSIRCSVCPDKAGGPPEGNTAAMADETLALLDPGAESGFFNMNFWTGEITQKNMSRTGYPEFVLELP